MDILLRTPGLEERIVALYRQFHACLFELVYFASEFKRHNRL